MNTSISSKIIWFLIGNPFFTASSRIHGVNIHNKLRALGYRSLIAYTPEHTEEVIPFDEQDERKLFNLFHKGDLVIIQKLKDERNKPFLQCLLKLGVNVIFIDCDLPISSVIGGMTTLVICPSNYLTSYYEDAGIKAVYIEDCPETFSPPRNLSLSENLKCYWFGDGSQNRWIDVLKLKNILSSDNRLKNWRLITISNHPDSDISWTPNFLEELKQADAIALPIFNESKENMVKSANRLLQSMALSIPVVCSPLRSYQDIINGEECGIICESEADWINAFVKLNNSSRRAAIGKAAFEKAKGYSIDTCIYNWIDNLKLDNKFRATNRNEERKEDQRFHQFYYRKLLKKDINYWSNRYSSLYNRLLFVYLKGKIFFQRF